MDNVTVESGKDKIHRTMWGMILLKPLQLGGHRGSQDQDVQAEGVCLRGTGRSTGVTGGVRAVIVLQSGSLVS